MPSYILLFQYIIIPWRSLTPALTEGLSLESKWQQVSSSHQDTSKYSAEVWMVSARPPISIPSSLFTKPLVIVPSAPVTIGITVTFMFHSYFSSLARSMYFYLFSFSLIFALWSTRAVKSTIRQFHLFFLFTITRFGLLVWFGLLSLFNGISTLFTLFNAKAILLEEQ